ncbi:MAG TPA: hypothetical protein VGM31_12285 [Puia sp.]
MLTVLTPQKWLAATLVSGSLFVTGCSHKLAPEGHFQDTPVAVDGSINDWTLPLRFSNPEYTLQYNVTNDSKNIYICVLSRDEITQLRMLRAGMTVYLDPKGAKNKDISLHFPLRKQADPERGRYRNGNPLPDNKTLKGELLLQSDFYGTTGFSGIENGQFGVTDAKGPFQVAMKLNNQDSMLVYEVVIPIKNVLGMDLGARSKKKNFSVGIVLNTVEGQGNRNGGNRPSFGGGGGGMHMSMGGGRGMGGGRRNYGSSGNSPLTKEEDNWYQFRLAAL